VATFVYQCFVPGVAEWLTLQTSQHTVCNQEAGQPGKLATDFLQLVVLHEISKKLYRWKA
jgi:hypothetical protein